MSRPVVTIVLYAHNEERYIREAVASVFAQTYSPLEIVLSDDGSTDRTYDIMRELAADYTGPHNVILNRNATHIGIGSQINTAWRRGSGELLVLANGDDVSVPHRVDRIVAEWMAGGRTAAGVSSWMGAIDEDGRPLGRFLKTRNDFSDLARATSERFAGPGAASLAVSRRCFERFGPLMDALIIEDGPLNLRATLTGGWIFIDDPLVLYRVHAANISHAYRSADFPAWRLRHRLRAQWQKREGQKAYVQMLVDLYGHGVRNEEPAAIQRARTAAARSLLQDQLLEAYYTELWPVSLREWWHSIVSLLVLVAKVTLKRAVPFIEKRNDRWHYRSVQQSTPARAPSAESEEERRA